MAVITRIKDPGIIVATEIQTPEMVTTETIIRIKDQATIMATGMVMTTLTKDPEITMEKRIYYKITFEG